jgi:putative transcriptional regulator
VESLRGQLLIAGPNLLDPNFHRTVVLITEHNDDGAMGIVLNRPSETEVAEVATELAEVLEDGAVVHAGGPVEPDSVIVLGEFEEPEAAGLIVEGDLGLLGADADLDALPGVMRRARVFVGYAGWGAGQLETELERDDWITATAARDDVFAHESASLWGTVLARMGGRYALLARMPLDPSVN